MMMMDMQIVYHFFYLWCKNSQLSEKAKYFLNKKTARLTAERFNLLMGKMR
jgi:hypothetical protein